MPLSPADDPTPGDVELDDETAPVPVHDGVSAGVVWPHPTARPDAAQASVARAMAREVAVHEAYDRARNTLRARNRRRALVTPTREMFSTPGRLDVHAGRSLPAYAWGVPVSRRGQLVAVICPTAGAVTPHVRLALVRTLIVVASLVEEERIRRVCEPGQRFVLLSVRVPEPAHEEIVEFARRTPVLAPVPGRRT